MTRSRRFFASSPWIATGTPDYVNLGYTSRGLAKQALMRLSRKSLALFRKLGLGSLLLRVGNVFFIRTFEVLDLAALEMPNARGHFVDDVVVVRHEQHRPVVPLQRYVQRVDRFQVEGVGRLVEHQEIGLLQHQPAKA